MSEIVEHDRVTLGRDDYEERKTRAFERRKREIDEEHARVARVAAEKQQHVVANNWDAWCAAIDQRIEQHFFSGQLGVGGALKDAIGGAMGKMRVQLREEFKHALDEMCSAFEAKLVALEGRQVLNNQAALVSWVDGRIEATLAHERDVLIEATGGAQGRAQLREEFKHAIEEMCSASGAELAALERRLKAVPGRLPVVKIWRQESVSYEAEVVSYDGSLWQARKDTAQVPGGSDWVCVARAGRDAVTPSVRGTYDAHKTYARLDIVEYDGAGYLARRDAPGVPGIPGNGWQLMSRSGRRGAAGETGPRGRKGERGARGEDAPQVLIWTVDPVHYRLVPTLSNGKAGTAIELRPLFERFCEEAIGPAVDAAVSAALRDAARTNPGLFAPL
jgi:hypothetical protein